MDDVDVLKALQRTLELVQSSRSSIYAHDTVAEIAQLLQGAIKELESGKLVDHASLGLLFAPTGSIQETSLANDWDDECLALSGVVDAFLADQGRGTVRGSSIGRQATATRVNEGELVSYLTLRRVVGVLGVALPVVLALWGFAICGCVEIQPSLSHYYGLRTRDALVGILFAIAWFLFTYRGYERVDDVAGNLACLCALGVALFPNSGTGWERALHFGSAVGLFLVLSYFSLFLFTKSGGSPTPEKKIRNRVYRACGVSMLVCIGLIGLCYWRLQDIAVTALKPVFWLESLTLWAFGISWFVKGETLWKDAGT